jgi:hypothetical protein
MATITCGRFSYNQETCEVEGPGDYMADKGLALIDSIMAGNDVVFNMTADRSPSAEMAVLVRLQTDFAGWRGVQQIANWMGGKRR